LLRRLTEAIRQGDDKEALRYADRARRLIPGNADVQRINARLLVRQGEADTALEILLGLSKDGSDGELEAEIIEALLALDHFAEAERRLAQALTRYAVAPRDRLAGAARRIIADPRCGAPGWMALSADLEVLGEVRLPAAGRLRIQATDGNEISPTDPAERPLANPPGEGADGSFEPFRASLKALRGASVLSAAVEGAALIGSEFAYPPDFGIDGRSNIQGSHLTGWVRLGWTPYLSPKLLIGDERGGRVSMDTRPDHAERRRHRFEFDLGSAGLRGHRITISAYLPNGGLEALPDAPLLLAKAVPPIGPVMALGDGIKAGPSPTRSILARPDPAPVAIVVPVYGGQEETLACIGSVRTTIPPGTRLVVVDDGSPEPALVRALDKLAAKGAIELLRNERNQGFPAAVNRALEVTAQHDVVLLNSDTVVSGDWLGRLRRAAYGARNIGTVTPLSNAGSIVSYPAEGKPEPDASSAVALDKRAAEANAGITVEIPTGVGFCLYIRADCLAATGSFDATTFGAGYGEENDFCLRARRLGWHHLLAADVFVYHAGGRSFGRRRQALMERNLRILNLRYPGYDAMVRTFTEADPIRTCRRRLDEARLLAGRERYALLVTLNLQGGVATAVAERCRQLRAQGLRPLVLKPQGAPEAESRPPGSPLPCRLTADDESLADLLYEMPAELPLLGRLLAQLPLAHIELHHFLDLDARAIDLVFSLDAPVDIHVHDYSWACPRITFLGGNGRYCGEPPISACELCLKTNGGRVGGSLTVAALRKRSARWLGAARRVVVPTADTKRRLAHHFPAIEPDIEPLEAPPILGVSLSTDGAARRPGPLRIALIGGIGAHKGYDRLLACAKDAARRQLPLEYVVVGHTEDDAKLMATGKVFVTGHYEERELDGLLRREKPDAIWFASLVPETWCFALSHAIRAGLPIIAFDLGAIGERLKRAPYARLLSPDLRPSALNRQFLKAMGSRGLHEAQVIDPISGRVPWTPAPGRTIQRNESRVKHMKQVSAEVTQDRMTVSVQLLTFAEGVYAFLVRSALPAKAAVDNNLLLPAVHVSRGPDAGGGEIEFMTGLRGRSTWLRDSDDVVMARVTGGPVSILLTSLRVAGAPALALEIQRVDGRSVLGHSVAGQADATPDAASPRTGILSKISAHIQNRGDMAFTEEPWAGLLGQRLWIESFSIEPQSPLGKGDIEYKGLTVTGFETPWLAGGSPCGTRGMGIPLIAFSVRLKPSATTAQYDCEYSGRFLSGATVGPLRNGAPCRSTAPNDPLEAIQLRILQRKVPEGRGQAAPKAEKPQARRQVSRSKARAKGNTGKPATPSRPGRRASKPQTTA
jgi:GT2 family glycosyltransferase